jgi:hypothetical protein
VSADGWYQMRCWNGLSQGQQQQLIEQGVLSMGRWVPEGGTCDRPAEVAIETRQDKAPGPRFYCRRCALWAVGEMVDDETLAEFVDPGEVDPIEEKGTVA